MQLLLEFEALRGSVLHQHPLPSLNEAVIEFTAEETCLECWQTSLTLVRQ